MLGWEWKLLSQESRNFAGIRSRVVRYEPLEFGGILSRLSARISMASETKFLGNDKGKIDYLHMSDGMSIIRCIICVIFY